MKKDILPFSVPALFRTIFFLLVCVDYFHREATPRIHELPKPASPEQSTIDSSLERKISTLLLTTQRSH